MKTPIFTIVSFALLVFAGAAAWSSGRLSGPNVVAPDRYVYYPGTEVLEKGEVRVIACGTCPVQIPNSGCHWQLIQTTAT